MIRLWPPLAAAAALLAFAHPGTAQDRRAQDILREVATRAGARMEGVQNYTLNTRTMGFGLVRYVSRGEDGTFQVQATGPGPTGASTAQMSGLADEMLLLVEHGLAQAEILPDEMDAFTYEGVVNSGGLPAHRIAVSLTDSAALADTDMPRRMTVDFDTVTLAIRRLEVEMPPGGSVPVTLLVELGDWRPVGRMLLPFRRHLVIRGIRGRLGGDTARVAQELEKARAMLAEVPESQRESARLMLAQTESMLKRDEVELDEIVVSVVVNKGPPPGFASAPGSGKNH